VSTDTVTTFLALLTVAAELFAVAGAVALVASAAASDTTFAAAVRDIASSAGVQVAFLVAATATAGSLYFSEVANFVPCTLCWYQRIAMYPLPLILAIALIRRASDVWAYAVPIALVGAAVSVYHVYVERSGHETGFCTRSAPCTTIWFEKFGYITLPVMALSAFAAVIVALLLARSARAYPV
jgi:disulfide bond formation protein DsbB